MTKVINWKLFLVLTLLFASILATQGLVISNDQKNVKDEHRILKQMGETAGY